MVTINPITCITGDEQERWLAEGNQDYLYGFVFSDDVVDPLEIKLKETTEYHMSIHPSDYPYEYVKEHCDRFLEVNLLPVIPHCFNTTYSITQNLRRNFIQKEIRNFRGSFF